MLFSNGKLMVNGNAKSVKVCKRRVRQYSRLIQRLGWNIQLKSIKISTISAHFKTDIAPNIYTIQKHYGGTYNPERFPAVMFNKDGINYTVFHTGSILMTGIKKENQIRNRCIPTILEMIIL